MAGIIRKLRSETESVNEKISAHRAVKFTTSEIMKRFVRNQLYIVPHDLSSLSILLARARSKDERSFFKVLVDGDSSADTELTRLADELGLRLELQEVLPRAVVYTHFLAWLALHGTLGDAAVALTVNLPVWGSNVGKLGNWAKSHGVESTTFFTLFKGPYGELEEGAELIARNYLNWDRYRFVVMAIQRYELDFWDAIYDGKGVASSRS